MGDDFLSRNPDLENPVYEGTMAASVRQEQSAADRDVPRKRDRSDITPQQSEKKRADFCWNPNPGPSARLAKPGPPPVQSTASSRTRSR